MRRGPSGDAFGYVASRQRRFRHALRDGTGNLRDRRRGLGAPTDVFFVGSAATTEGPLAVDTQHTSVLKLMGRNIAASIEYTGLEGNFGT